MAEMESGLDQVTLGDKKVDIQTYDRYKGRKNVTDRIAVLSSTLIRGRIHFHDAKKKSFKCLSTAQHQAVCCKHMGEPDQKFGLIIFQYLTDETGSLLTDEKCTGKIKLWIVSESRYAELSQIHKEFPLLDAGFGESQVDLTMKCTEEQYQRMTFTPCREAFWKKKKEWYDALKLKEEKARSRLVKAMGNDLSELEILDLLEVDAGRGSHSPSMGDIDVGDVLE